MPPLRELKELKPLKLPGEKDPAKAIAICPKCNCECEQDAQICKNCGQTIIPNIYGPHQRKVQERGTRLPEFGDEHMFIEPGSPLNMGKSKNIVIEAKKRVKDLAEHDKDTVKEKYISDEFNQCMDPKKLKKKKNVDDIWRTEEVFKSCRDLAIDG